jgi:hypothetical protein
MYVHKIIDRLQSPRERVRQRPARIPASTSASSADPTLNQRSSPPISRNSLKGRLTFAIKLPGTLNETALLNRGKFSSSFEIVYLLQRVDWL